ncbi:MAG: HEAT repeat domain-containing protein [Verrucomicrobiota bacterium]
MMHAGNKLGIGWLLASLWWALSAMGQTPPPTFEGAKWIWYAVDPDEASMHFPAGAHCFRAAVVLPETAPVKAAEIIVTADNLYTVYLNGKPAGESSADPNAWNQPKRFDVTALLAPGRNVLAVEAINTAPGPAGLLLKLSARMADGSTVTLVTDDAWRCNEKETPNWEQPGFDDRKWRLAFVVGDYGVPPWGKIAVRSPLEPAGQPPSAARQRVRQVLTQQKAAARNANRQTPAAGNSVAVAEVAAPENYAWPEAVVFVGEDCSLYRPLSHTGTGYDSLNVTIFNPRKSRGFPEHDLPAPMKVGRKLFALQPAKPGSTPRLLLDAGKGGLGSPGVSFDGRSVFFSMAREGEAFFHIYQLDVGSGKLVRLTEGPFHDIDPAELPDGRIVFTSTRIGYFEEYHNPPSRSLFMMNADGGNVHPLTHTFIFDNEPEIMADGRILFLRTDNFFDRGKVETLLHAVHPDGTEGYTEFGLELGPDYGGRLRAFVCGSPAPMPDGRVAFVSGPGITIGQPGSAARDVQHLRVEAGDVAALPDGRLLCTTPVRRPVEIPKGKEKQTVQDLSYEKIMILDPESQPPQMVLLHTSSNGPLHSPVYLGARRKPPQLAEKVTSPPDATAPATGVLFCQNARFTKNTKAGWPQIKAIRVLAGKGLTVRSSHSYIVHAGSEVRELGTVPLAPDGSFAVEVPADTAIAFQAVDAEGRSELNEMSWIYVRPGEQRGCIGCHQPRQSTPPPGAVMQAMRTPPLKLLGQGQPHRFRGNNAAVTGLMELQFDRYREVAGINRHSETAAPLATGGQEVSELIGQLQGKDPALKISAAQRLALFRNPAAAPALAQCLRDPSRELRVAAALALSTCGNRESIPALLATLTDVEPMVAQAGVVALENLTVHVEPFNAYDPMPHRTAQADAWREWFKNNAWEKIEADLVSRLDTTNRDTVRRVAVALGHVGGEPARAALRAYVSRERDDTSVIEWRKTHQGDGARFNSLEAMNPRTVQAATRALGYLKDAGAVPMLAETLIRHSDPDKGNLFLAEAAAEALGRIGTPEAETALINAFIQLKDYPRHTSWYGDHGALMACHASPVHYFITEALDALGTTHATNLIPFLIRSVPTDPDRALLLVNDDCETLIGRVIRRSGAEAAVVETCLGILGDAAAVKTQDLETAIATTHQAWGGKPDPENRAAQILSLTCRDTKYEPRIRAALDRYQMKSTDIPRVFDTGIPVVKVLPVKHWVCFFLARTLGNLAQPQSADALLAALEQSPTEAAPGRPDPFGPGVLFLHNDLTPCWRAAVAWALGRIGDRRAAPLLLKVIADLNNAPDTRYTAAEALTRMRDPDSMGAIKKLAANYPEVSTRRVLLETLQP